MSNRSESPDNSNSKTLRLEVNPAFDRIAKALTTNPPYCSGTLDVGLNDLIVFYGKDAKNAGRIHFGDLADGDLKGLSDVCAPATFGRNQEDIHDETYRKSRKLDVTQFNPIFDVHALGFADILRKKLFTDQQQHKSIRMERYKLNIYEQGSFFKPHVDTPRGEGMFGSLVIVFPTPHTGGKLVLRDGHEDWSIDAAAEMQAKDHPCVTYIAFYGDVEHEVLPIETGYRVTITYNLYFTSRPDPIYSTLSDPGYSKLHADFEEILADPTVLPGGGHLGFGLRRRYGLGPTTDLSVLSENPKGGDALLMQVCRDLSLDVSLRVFYKSDDCDIRDDLLIDKIPRLQGDWLDEDIAPTILAEYPKTLRVVPPSLSPWDKAQSKPDIAIEWVLGDLKNGGISQNIVTYGNEPSLDTVYINVCLIVVIGPSGDRRDTTKIKTLE